MRQLPVSVVAVVTRLSPTFVILIAFFVLGERLKCFDIVSLMLALSGALMIVLGLQSENESVTERSPWLFVALAASPVLTAFGEVTLRKMRKLPAATVMCYTNYALAILSLLMMWIKSEPFDFFTKFDLISWLLVSTLSVVLLATHNLKYLAY